jgi:hypothetical protein
MTALDRIPPYRQSIGQSMACESGYRFVHIDQIKFPSTEPAERGIDVHFIKSQYARHCAEKHVPADFAFLDSLCYAAGEEAVTILENCRDNIVIDWENFFASEIHMGLDSKFRPTWSYDHDGNRVEIDPVWGIKDSGEEPEYCAIADEIYMMPGRKASKVIDSKTHPRSFPADTDQGKLYSLMILMHMPSLQENEFVLQFVRYENLNTTQKYYRSDVPDLMAAVRRMRARQVLIHEKVANREPLRTHGGPQCSYCPCVLNPVAYPCPLGNLNTFTNLTPEDRLRWELANRPAAVVNRKAMEQHVLATGQPIRTQDANGKWYEFSQKEVKEVTAPLFEEDGRGGFIMPILDALLEWANTNYADMIPRKGSKPWFCNLKIGWTDLKKYLKAQKREIVHNRIKPLLKVTNSLEFRITKDPETDDGIGNEKPWDAAGEEDIEF